ncbi:uncharacterized protein AMSG_04268 [Thecamonas trahens ATCC 50062]|uniref:Uncharacterized protein n=1 Tax=Thecamonas trahens ATCC 50062 TaxID=461836 RepID=A0A0L0D750_THETB|nr:hypothetical protein AMSG_04268 [Thecamonas trahens ATCC 50062]KNC48035.1 hypothetical protein AMSG_04268 [Thecamonas trahens ATCC 50062]|eukprot:XP_013759050.1 hypothetical protein AMSG_04268 [Thecamonas trahens ATCC 50062]
MAASNPPPASPGMFVVSLYQGDSLAFSPATPPEVMDHIVKVFVDAGRLLQRDLFTKKAGMTTALRTVAKFKGYMNVNTKGLVWTLLIDTMTALGYAYLTLGNYSELICWPRGALDPPPPVGELFVLTFGSDELYLSGRGPIAPITALAASFVGISELYKAQKAPRFHRTLDKHGIVAKAGKDGMPVYERWRVKFKGYPMQSLTAAADVFTAAAAVGLMIETPLTERTFLVRYNPDAAREMPYMAISLTADTVRFSASTPDEFHPIFAGIIAESADIVGYTPESVVNFDPGHAARLAETPPLAVKREAHASSKWGREDKLVFRGYPLSWTNHMLMSSLPHIWQLLQERWSLGVIVGSLVANTATLFVPAVPSGVAQPAPRAFSVWTTHGDTLHTSALAPAAVKTSMADYFERIGLRIQRGWKPIKGRYGARRIREQLAFALKLRGYPLLAEMRAYMLLRSPLSTLGQVVGTVPAPELPAYSVTDAPPSYADIAWENDEKKSETEDWDSEDSGFD